MICYNMKASSLTVIHHLATGQNVILRDIVSYYIEIDDIVSYNFMLYYIVLYRNISTYHT